MFRIISVIRFYNLTIYNTNRFFKVILISAVGACADVHISLILCFLYVFFIRIANLLTPNLYQTV